MSRDCRINGMTYETDTCHRVYYKTVRISVCVPTSPSILHVSGWHVAPLAGS